MVKQELNKSPMDIVEGAIIFLNNLTEEDIIWENIHDRILVITWASRVVNKHSNLKMVEEKWNFMQK